MIKKTIRLNVTNKCNMACGTCPISANPSKNGYMKFYDYQNILNEYNHIPLDIVLEGGEPFLHPRWNLMIEYADTLCNAKRVIISTNGTLVQSNYSTLLDIAKRLRICLQLNIGITKHLIEMHEGHLDMCKSLLSEDDFHIYFDVTYTSEEEKEELITHIKNHRIPLDKCSFSIVRAYGSLKDTEYPKLDECNRQTECYATDGTYFGWNLEERAEHELTLCSEEDTPVFDIVNHRQLWLLTHGFIADISYEMQDNCKQSVKDFQLGYFRENTPNVLYSYILDFYNRYGDEREIFYTSNVHLMEREVVDGLTNLMEETIDVKRFYAYKEMAMNLCLEIAHMKVRDDIQTTEDDCYICRK